MPRYRAVSVLSWILDLVNVCRQVAELSYAASGWVATAEASLLEAEGGKRGVWRWRWELDLRCARRGARDWEEGKESTCSQILMKLSNNFTIHGHRSTRSVVRPETGSDKQVWTH